MFFLIISLIHISTRKRTLSVISWWSSWRFRFFHIISCTHLLFKLSTVNYNIWFYQKNFFHHFIQNQVSNCPDLSTGHLLPSPILFLSVNNFLELSLVPLLASKLGWWQQEEMQAWDGGIEEVVGSDVDYDDPWDCRQACWMLEVD